MDSIFRAICNEFDLKGVYIDYKVIKAGNINDTYIITNKLNDGEINYIVQRVNTVVFNEPHKIASNVVKITTHIQKRLKEEGDKNLKRKVLRMYKTKSGEMFYSGNNGDSWRVLSYIFDSVNYNQVDNRILQNAGSAFGTFQRLLSDFPAEVLHITIPDFHNTEKRFRALFETAQKDPVGRRKEVEGELEYLKSKEECSLLFNRLLEEGKVFYRVTHNDTKCNNVMFDIKTGEPLAVIDLDTVMPGFVAHDFGDAIRFAANNAEEDEEDLSKVFLDLSKFESFAKGFIPPIKDLITKTEYDTLADGVLVMTLELASRFLTDYLNGDKYFKVKKPKHNLVRALCQIQLAKDIEQKMPEMRRIMDSLCY